MRKPFSTTQDSDDSLSPKIRRSSSSRRRQKIVEHHLQQDPFINIDIDQDVDKEHSIPIEDEDMMRLFPDELKLANPTTSSVALKEQEKIMDELRKENFNLKLRVHYLEERLLTSSPDNVQSAFQENIDLKVEVENLKSDLSQFKDLLTNAYAAIESLRQNPVYNEDNDEKWKQKLEQKDQELNNIKFDWERMKNEQKMKFEKEKEEAEIRWGQMVQESEQDLIEFKIAQSDLQAKLHSRDVELNKLSQENDVLRLRLENSSQLEQKSIDSNNSRHTTSVNAELEEGLQVMRSKLADLNMELIEKNNDAHQARLNMENDQLKNKQMMKSMEDTFKREKTSLQEMIDSLKLQLDREREEKKKHIHHLSHLNASQQSLSDSHQQHMQMLNETVEQKTKEMEYMKEQLERVQNEKVDIEQHLSEKNQSMEDLFHQIQHKDHRTTEEEIRLGESVDQLKVRLAELRNENHEIRLSVRNKDSDILLLKDEIERRTQQLVSSEERWVKKYEEAEKSHDETQQALNETLRSQKHKLETISNNMAITMSQKTETEASMNRELDVLKEEKINLKIEKDRLQKDQIALKSQIAEMEDSRETEKEAYISLDSKTKNLVEDNNKYVIHIQRIEQDRQVLLENTQSLKNDLYDARQELSKTKADVNLKSDHLKSRTQSLQNEIHQSKEKNAQIEERDFLLEFILHRVQNILGQYGGARHSLHLFTQEFFKPGENFTQFSDNIKTYMQQLDDVPHAWADKIKVTEERFMLQLESLKRKTDRKIEQIEKFEGIVIQAGLYQKKLKEAITKKSKETEIAKTAIIALENQLASFGIKPRRQEQNASKSQVIPKEDADMTRLRHKLQESIIQLQSSENKRKDLENELKNFKHQCQTQKNQLESNHEEMNRIKNRYENTHQNLNEIAFQNSLKTSQRDRHVMDLVDSNQSLRKELIEKDKYIERERDRVTQLDKEYRQLLTEHSKLQKRLERKESLIGRALNRLERLGHRKDHIEMALLQQVTEDVNQIMTEVDKSPSDHSSHKPILHSDELNEQFSFKKNPPEKQRGRAVSSLEHKTSQYIPRHSHHHRSSYSQQQQRSHSRRQASSHFHEKKKEDHDVRVIVNDLKDLVVTSQPTTLDFDSVL